MKTHQAGHAEKGITLLEMTVVILVILGLVSVLFISATVWKRNADRSSNLLNLRNIQHAVRGHQDLYGLREGTSPLSSADIFSSATNTSGYLPEPKPPSNTGIASYSYMAIVPPYGQLYVNNTSSMHPDYIPPPSYYANW